MSAPASSDLRELETELVNRADQGSMMLLAEVREMFGVGHDDALSMLGVLRDHGKAVEVAPGEWRGPSQDELEAIARAEAAPEPVRVSVPDASSPAVPGWLAEHSRMVSAPEDYASVRLTRAMVQALDDDALGKLVRAGVEGSSGVFALEVG